MISRLNADGSWSPLERLSSGDTSCNQEPIRWGISGNTVVAGTWTNDTELVPDQMHIFRRSGTTWMPTSPSTVAEARATCTAMRSSSRAASRTARLVYRNDDSLTVVDVIRTVSTSYVKAGVRMGFTHTDDVFVQEGDVFRKNAAGKYEHVAILKPRGPYGLSDDVKISGRRVISQAYRDHTSSNQAALIFDLPATYIPSRVVATGFENGAPPVNPQLGTFAVVTRPYGNHVYRQSSLVGRVPSAARQYGLGRAIHRSRHQNDGLLRISEEWAGLAVRYLDAANYYAVALRSTGVVELRFMRNGVSTVKVQKPLAIVAGRTYHVSLQAYGTMITVRINNGDFLWWDEEKPVGHGSAALLGNQTTADYDNVVVAQVGQRPIFSLLMRAAMDPSRPTAHPSGEPPAPIAGTAIPPRECHAADLDRG